MMNKLVALSRHRAALYGLLALTYLQLWTYTQGWLEAVLVALWVSCVLCALVDRD